MVIFRKYDNITADGLQILNFSICSLNCNMIFAAGFVILIIWIILTKTKKTLSL